MRIVKDLGIVTAYGYAVAGGYTGTEADFIQLMEDIIAAGVPAEAILAVLGNLAEDYDASGQYSAGDYCIHERQFHRCITDIPTGEEWNALHWTAVTVSEVLQEINDILEHKAEIDGLYENLTSGNSEQLVSTIMVEDKDPYNFRTAGGSADIGNRAYDMLVGGTLVWNQLAHALTTDDWSIAIGAGFTGTSSIVDGVVTIHIDSATASVASLGLKNEKRKGSIPGHKYLFSAVIQTTNGKACFVPTQISSDGTNGYTSYPTKTRASWIWDCGTSNANCAGMRVGTGSGITGEVDVTIEDYNAYDLTQMFGPAIADYVYGLEQATPGAGVAWFRKLFPKDYYAYDAGSLQSVQAASHDMIGFNQWDEVWEVGSISSQTGQNMNTTTTFRSKNYIPVFPSTVYNVHYGSGYGDSSTGSRLYPRLYDADKKYLGTVTSIIDGTFTTPATCRYMRFVVTNSVQYNNDICVNLSWSGYRNGEYEPYIKRSYALDDALTLRGIPKLDAANNLYYDGDAYERDGTVTRRYGIVDMGTLMWDTTTGYGFNMFFSNSLDGLINSANANNFICERYSKTGNSWATMPDDTIRKTTNSARINIHDDSYTDADTFKAAMSGVYLVYELATPTTETADPFQFPQIVDDFGTEEYVDAGVTASTPTRDVAIPVGHVTRYSANLRDKLQHLPDLADSDGQYVITQNGSQMTLTEDPSPGRLTALEAMLPGAPTTDGTYSLHVTVADGVPTYSWVTEV